MEKCVLGTPFTEHIQNTLLQNTFYRTPLVAASKIRSSSQYRSSRSEMLFKTGVVKNVAKSLGKHQRWRQSIKKETPAQVFSCEFCEIFKNSFVIENL